MTEETLHPVPRRREVVLEQIRIAGLSLRPAMLVGAAVLGVVTLLIARDIVRGSAASWFDSQEWFPLSLIAFFVPFAVWRTERRFGPAFLWTLPVDRRLLALAKVLAGWVWTMIALAAYVLWHLVLALVSGVADPLIIPPIVVIGTTATYVLGSTLVVGLRYPLRWLFGTAGVFVLLRAADDVLLRGGPYSIDALLSSVRISSALEVAATSWPFPLLGAALVALWAAVSRHRETR